MASKPVKKSVAIARVQVTLELDAGSSWGNDCTVQQIYDQAGRESINNLEQILLKAGVRVHIVGEPKVVAVMTERER